MRPNFSFIIKIILGILSLILYCEYVVYYVVLRNCDWPELDSQNEDATIAKSVMEPVKIMVLADTHLLGSRHGHWFDKLRREWQMHRAFQTAMVLHKPDLVFVLGDLTDEGLYCSSKEFEYYVRRFYSLFEVPKNTQMYVAVGNHDIGFHYGISPYLNERFVSAFNAPAVQLISMRGNHFILINSMAMEGDGCFLCRDAELQLNKIEKILKCSNGTFVGKCNSEMTVEVYSKPILMQHYPLYRESDKECNDPDSAPPLIKNERFRETWDCLSKEASVQILNQFRPRLALSGHTHHGCTKQLPGGGVEITLPSFSWRNKNNPTYGLGLFVPNNYAFSKCAMPTESTVINLYIFGLSCLIIWFIYLLFNRLRRCKRKFN